MTFSKKEFYGGSNHFEFSIGTPTYTIGFGDYTRVLYFTEDSVLATVTVNLPDALLVRQLGWMYYFIANDTSANLELKDFTGFTVITLSPNECGSVGLTHKNDSGGGWFVDTDDCVHDPPPPPPPPTASIGGAFMNRDTWLYAHLGNSWSQALNTPVDSHFAQAANVKKLASEDMRSFWKHLRVHYEFNFPFDSHTARTDSPTANEQTGSARLRDGDGVALELYLSWASINWENVPSIYNQATDAWTTATPLTGVGAALVPFFRCVTSAGFVTKQIGTTWLAYMITAEPQLDADSFEFPYFWAYQSTLDTHYELPMLSLVPVPPNRWQASMVNLGEAVHVVGGSIVVASPDIPEDASARHVRYSGSLVGFWVARPQLPDPVMGMGVETITGIANKFTLGMGQNGDDTTGSANHWEYDETSQSYTARSVDSWFQKNTQEGSWCVAGI